MRTKLIDWIVCGFLAAIAPGLRAQDAISSSPGDLATWQEWWERNKAPYLDLKAAIHSTEVFRAEDAFILGPIRTVRRDDTLLPNDDDLRNHVLPALLRSLEGTTNRELGSACPVALAKIGKDDAAKGIRILDVFKKHLKSSDAQVREAAALALGISQMATKGNLEDLVDHATDTPAGRKLVGRVEVDDRTRSFAYYAIGLVAHASTDVAAKASAFEALRRQLADERDANRNLKVAAIQGMRMLRIAAASPADEKHELRDAVLASLWSYYDRKTGPGEQWVQAHVPPAIAQLVGRGNDKVRRKFKDAFLHGLDPVQRAEFTEPMAQSCAIALGLLVERTKEDQKYVDGLARYVAKGKDPITKYFALIALGEIGGPRARSALLESCTGADESTLAWAAIAVGILGFQARKEGGPETRVDRQAGLQLKALLGRVRTSGAKGALAIGLGLLQFTDAVEDLRELLEKNRSQDELAGHLALALAFLDDARSIEVLHGIVTTSRRRPDLLEQAAIALAKLGDKTVNTVLQEMLTGSAQSATEIAAIAAAYGVVGDRRAIAPIVELLLDTKLSDQARASAAAALGGVGDKEALPWNSRIARDMNYRASVETLLDGMSGVLDIR